MKTLTKQLDDEEQKALEWDILDLDFWFNNWFKVKIGQCADRICELALNDTTGTILSEQDKQDLRTYLDANNIIVATPSQLPTNVKREIVKRANVPSAAERKAAQENQP